MTKHEIEQPGFLDSLPRAQDGHKLLHSCLLERQPPAPNLRARRNPLGKSHGEERRATHRSAFLCGLWRRCTKVATTRSQRWCPVEFAEPAEPFSRSQRCLAPRHAKSSRFRPAHRVALWPSSRSPQHSRPRRSIDVQSRERPAFHGERRGGARDCLLQYRPNSACRGSTSCIAPRSIDAFWYLRTLDRLR